MGELYYFNNSIWTAFYNVIRPCICDKCWGSGDNENPFLNLREHMHGSWRKLEEENKDLTDTEKT
jgi:hypothetical protein